MSLLSLKSELGCHFKKQRLLAVVSINDAARAVPLAEALLRGGVDTIELTLRTPAALEAVKRITSEVPAMTVGTGTVLNEAQVDDALAAGAHFGVSPSVNRSVLRHAKLGGFPFAPGIMTPTDIDISLQEGCDLLKFFPATSSGGLPHLQNIAAPFAHLGIGFIPLGGINPGNLGDWLDDPKIVAVGGSWLAPPKLIDEAQWDQIEANVREARKIESARRGDQDDKS